MPLKHVFFDLDGTLTDPVEGIAGSIRHALDVMGIQIPPLSTLKRYIGPSLRTTFSEIIGGKPGDARIERAVNLYRERFSTVGIFENSLYPGIPDMLEKLRRGRFNMYVATSKPREFAVRICEHFGLLDCFDGIYGPELNGSLDDKSELLEYLLIKEGIAPRDAVMVGDRKHDIIAARNNGIASIGVTYGYGTVKELARADLLCDSAGAVAGGVKKLAKGKRLVPAVSMVSRNFQKTNG